MLVDVESLASKEIRQGMSALDTLEALQALGCTLDIRKEWDDHERFVVELTTPVSNHAEILKQQGIFRATTYHRHLTTAIVNLLRLIHDRVQRASNS